MKIKAFVCNPFGETTYIVWDSESRQAAIIDPGMITDEEHLAIEQFVSDNFLSVKYLINTHLHLDHVFGNARVEEKYGLKTMANAGDAPLGRSLSSQPARFGMRWKLNDIELENVISEGDVLTLGSERLIVIETPGHSPGSISLYCPESGFLISGDTLFRRSVGRTDLPGGSQSQIVASIRNKLFTLPPQTKVYPGHGPATTIGDEIRANPFV